LGIITILLMGLTLIEFKVLINFIKKKKLTLIMRPLIVLFSIILFSTMVIASQPTIPCEPLEQSSSYYEKIIETFSDVNDFSNWEITTMKVNDCMVNNEVRIMVSYSSSPDLSTIGLSYKTTINHIFQEGILVDETKIINFFNDFPNQIKKFENDERISFFLSVTNANEATIDGLIIGMNIPSEKSIRLTNKEQKVKSKTYGFQEDSLVYLLDSGDLRKIVLITPGLLEKKELFSPQMFDFPKIVEFEEKVGISKIEVNRNQIKLYENRDCFTCRSELTFTDSEITQHKLDYTLQWENYPEINQVLELVSNELIPKHNLGCELYSDFSSTPKFTLLKDGSWDVLFTLNCPEDNKNYWREITFKFYSNGNYGDYRIKTDSKSILNKINQRGLNNWITFAVIILIVILIFLRTFFFIRKKRKKLK
jgi:hypothetical protein